MAAGVSISSLRVLGFTCLALLLVETAGFEGAPYNVLEDVMLEEDALDLRMLHSDITLLRQRRDASFEALTNNETVSDSDTIENPPLSTPTPPTTTPTQPTTPAPTASTILATTTTPMPKASSTTHSTLSSTTTTPTTTTNPPQGGASPTTPSPTPAPTPQPTQEPTPEPSEFPTEEDTFGTNETEYIEEKDHKYYRSRIMKGDEALRFWVDLDDMGTSGTKMVHKTLSHSHRTAATAKLTFMFPFYGHAVYQVTIATGGFIYMSSFLHQWLTATQYIAPLMANFDTQIGDNSRIIYADNGTAFAVQWESVFLQDHHKGSFSFQAVLHKDGHVVFAYKQLGSPIDTLRTEHHPVKVGLSDAYYEDKKISQEVRRRTIYEYNRVAINFDAITNNTAVMMLPNPTCIAIDDCKQCITSNNSFDCQWCPDAGRCSDGLDRKRQDWLVRRCHEANFKAVDECYKYPARPGNGGKGSGGAKRRLAGQHGIRLGAVLAIVLLLVLIIAIFGWLFYAYRHPTSRSGMWLIEHRPSMLKAKLNKVRFWKRGGSAGDKYEVSVQPEGDIVA